MKSFLLSVPFGLFTTAILFANEIPDFTEDSNAGKNTWVKLVGAEKSFILYSLLVGLGFLSIIANVFLGFLNPWACLTLMLIVPAFFAAKIIKTSYDSKFKLIQSSKFTILIQTFVSISLIVVSFVKS